MSLPADCCFCCISNKEDIVCCHSQHWHHCQSHHCFYKHCCCWLIYSSHYCCLWQDCQKLLLLWKFLLLPGVCCQWMFLILTPWQQCHCLLRYPMTLPTLAQHGSHSQLIVTILHFSFFLKSAFFAPFTSQCWQFYWSASELLILVLSLKCIDAHAFPISSATIHAEVACHNPFSVDASASRSYPFIRSLANSWNKVPWLDFLRFI